MRSRSVTSEKARDAIEEARLLVRGRGNTVFRRGLAAGGVDPRNTLAAGLAFIARRLGLTVRTGGRCCLWLLLIAVATIATPTATTTALLVRISSGSGIRGVDGS